MKPVKPHTKLVNRPPRPKRPDATQLSAVLGQKEQLIQQVIAALNHLPRDRAIATVLSWFSIADLTFAVPTLCGSEPPVTDPIEAFIRRLRIALMERKIECTIHSRLTFGGLNTVKVSADKGTGALFEAALREALDK